MLVVLLAVQMVEMRVSKMAVMMVEMMDDKMVELKAGL